MFWSRHGDWQRDIADNRVRLPADTFLATVASGEPMYYLQNLNAGYCGNSPMLWRKGGSGYTPDIDDAELFTKESAMQIKRSTRGNHSWRLISERKAKRAIVRMLDAELLK